jgi:hypothetical protein
MQIEIRDLGRDYDCEVVRFLDHLGQSDPCVLAYHYPFYRDMLVALQIGCPEYLGAYAKGSLVGFLPVFRKDSSIGTVHSSLPHFAGNGGVLCVDNAMSTEIHRRLLHALFTRASERRSFSCSLYTPFLRSDFRLYDENMPEAVIAKKFTQYVDLKTTDWSRHSLRQNLRKAEQSGVEVSTEITPNRVAAFKTIYEQHCRNQGIPPRDCIDFLAHCAMDSRHVRMYFALYDRAVIAALIVLFSPLTASSYLTCSMGEKKTLQPGVLLIDRAIQDARQRGIRFWDFEGSPSPGVYRFKTKWGAVEAEYRIYVQLFQSTEVLRDLGPSGISQYFPGYYVYPFDKL